ncbi:hypothetical protein LguiB_005232 [Lonicera macranthoides]
MHKILLLLLFEKCTHNFFLLISKGLFQELQPEELVAKKVLIYIVEHHLNVKTIL